MSPLIKTKKQASKQASKRTNKQTNKQKKSFQLHQTKNNIFLLLQLFRLNTASIQDLNFLQTLRLPQLDPGHNLCSSKSNPGEHWRDREVRPPGGRPGLRGRRRVAGDTYMKHFNHKKGISNFLCELVWFKVVSTILFCVFFWGEMIHKFDDYMYVQED